MTAYDTWLEPRGATTAETCANGSEHGIYLRPGGWTVTLDGRTLSRLLASEDGIATALHHWLLNRGVAMNAVSCPMAGRPFGEDDYAAVPMFQAENRCGTCGGPLREMDREEMRP